MGAPTPLLGTGGVHVAGGGLVIPDSSADAVYWLDVDFTTNTGDGSQITAAEDQGSGGHAIAAVTTGPTYRATAWGGNPCMEVSTGTLRTATTGAGTAPNLVNSQDVSALAITVIEVCQVRHHLGTYLWSFDDVGSTNSITCRANSSAYLPQIYGNAGSNFTFNATTNWEHGTPMVFTTRINGGSLTFRRDGSQLGTAVSWTATGTGNCDYFSVGRQQNFTGQTYYVTDVIVFNRVLSDAEVAEWELYLGQRRFAVPWKEAWGATGDWLVASCNGQSNEAGYGTTQNLDYTESVSDAYFMSLDGFVYPLATETHDGANKVPPSLTYQTPAAASKHKAMAAQMRTNGETRKLLFVANAHINTDSAAWINSLTTNPPNINTLTGNAKYRTRAALFAPGASLFFSIDQGEANCDNLTEAQAWQTQWASWCTEMNTYFSGSFEKTTHFLFARLSVNISGVGANAADVRASQDALDTARSDVVLYQRPDGTDEATPGLHLTGPEQQQNGYDAADAWDAAS